MYQTCLLYTSRRPAHRALNPKGIVNNKKRKKKKIPPPINGDSRQNK